MAQDIVNNNQGISYTNLDFSSIYTEVLDLIKKLTYKWDPSISDESDPGVILVKLSALIADKCNYNIDKSILEAFPLSVTQQGNARQLYEQLGYYMGWYEAASVPVVLNWISKEDTTNQEVKEYTIPKFTPICDADEEIMYSLIGVEGPDGVVVSNGTITTDSKEIRMIAMEGVATQYTYMGDSKVITAQMVDKDTHRIYFSTSGASGSNFVTNIAQNGIFITNTGQSNYASWKRVDNIYEQPYSDLRYKFGYDQYSQGCYLEFPDNYAELIGDGIEITYLLLSTDDAGQKAQDIPAQALTKFLTGIVPAEDTSITLNSSNVFLSNYAQASGHKDLENINDAYINYKKTVGTFRTLITLRDYLNYIKSKDLDICSNAFVCDRTNDVQTVYKVVSKQHGLDSILVNIEQIVDKTPLESNFDYTFTVSGDENSIPGKTYYIIENDSLREVSNATGGHPRASGWYEFTSRIAKRKESLNAFSLKFYMLKNSILLNTKQAFNETFDMIDNNVDIASILSDTSHLEHDYENILPIGTNTYKPTLDTNYLANKAYYIQDNDINTYKLYTNYTVGNEINVQTNTVYEVDVEALMPHTVFFKNIYPLTANISTYDSLNEKTQEEIQKNIINALYVGVNSSQLNFGDAISTIYLEEIVKASDTRIRSVSFDPFNYTTKAIYYDGEKFKAVTIPSSIDSMGIDQKDEDSVIGNFIAKDVVAKSILCGVTSLLVPDDIFTFHLNHRFIDYFDNVYSITSQAIIDIGGKDALTTYSSDSSNPSVRQSYTLKPNEALHLYRPQLETVREFSSGIHFECFLYNDIRAGQSYELSKNEYIIFYQSNYSGDTTTGQPDGFSVYACTKGVIVNPSFDITSQTNINTLSNFATGKVLPYFDVNTSDNLFETNTYAYNYVTEIFNNSIIRSNAITGTNTIKLQTVYEVTINEEDNYKFFWALKTPKYSNENNIKSYTLFPEYDITRHRLTDKEKNSYTLKAGEYLYYTDSSYSNLAILGQGTTIFRNCGINSTYDDDHARVLYEYVNTKQFSSSGTDIRFNDGRLEQLVNSDDTVNPHINGWYEFDDSTNKYYRTSDNRLNSEKDYYVLVINDNAGLYKRIGDEPPYDHASTLTTSNVFSEVDVNSYMCNINPSEENLYEIVSSMSSSVTDYYALSEGASYNDYLRYTLSEDTTNLTRNIFVTQDYADINIEDTNTYKTISITEENKGDFDYIANKLVMPSNGDASYKAYYTYDESLDQYDRVTNISILDNPSDANRNHMEKIWYEIQSDSYVETSDTRPKIKSDTDSLKYPDTITVDYCFDEVPMASWPIGDVLNYMDNGYYYKFNSSTVDYIFPDTNQFGQSTTISMLEGLMYIFREAQKNHGETSYTNIINYIDDNWSSSISYNNPFKTEDKLGWRTKRFRTLTSEETSSLDSLTLYYGFTKADFENNNIKEILPYATPIYPRFSLTIDYESNDLRNRVDLVIPKIDNIPQGATPIVLVEDEYNEGYIEILDRTSPVTDQALCNYLENLNTTFTNLYSFNMEYAPRIYKFKDLIRMISKIYYKPDLYVEKTFGTVDAWSCEALDNDEIAEDPIRVISDKWQSLQPNTSITIDQNEIWSFAEGDTLRFEAPVATQNSVVWPRFGNTETPLDLNKYSISYQRKGSSIEDLDNLILSGHQWQGYSNLILNTSNKDGQKLESNQSIILYNENNREISIINGSDYENVTFQLKSPVSNVAGRYIDVTTADVFGNYNPNSIYEFVPLVNYTANYKYTSDHKTYTIFDTQPDSQGFYHILNSTVQIPILLPEGRYLIPIYTDTEGVNYWINRYISTRTPDTDNREYCINMDAEYAAASSGSIRISGNSNGEHIYSYNRDKTLGYKLMNTDYNYLDIVNEVFSDKLEEYVNIDTSFAPNFNDREYYTYEDEEYVLLTEEPDDWSTNWFSYYTKQISYKYYRKVKLPAYITAVYFDDGSGVITKSPQDLEWYELTQDGHYIQSTETGVGVDLIEEVESHFDSNNWVKYTNPYSNGWYEKLGVEGSYYYSLTSDIAPVYGKKYYKDKDFYISTDVLSDPVLRINAENPLISVTSNQVYIIFEDVFKYNNNSLFDEYSFNEVKQKIKELDVDTKYNYAFIPGKNDEIKDPLIPISFFEKNHPFNNYVIPQLDFDSLYFRFPVSNTTRR